MASVSLSVPPEIYRMLMYTGVAVGGYFLIKKGVRQAKSNSVDIAFDTDTKDGVATRFATVFYQAIHENDYFGFSEDEAAILRTGKKIRDANIAFSLVAKKYRNKYGKDLLRDIQRALSSSDFQRFQDQMTGLGRLIVPENIYLKNPTRVFDETFQRSVIMPFTGRPVGRLRETVIIGARQLPFYGFKRGKELYYVQADKAILKRA